MTSAGKVAEIFSAAGEAFTRLGSLAMHLQPLSTKDPRSNENGKWGDEEIELLRSAVRRFGQDLEKISEQIKTKSLNQIKSALKQKALKELGKDSAQLLGGNSNAKATSSQSSVPSKHKSSTSSVGLTDEPPSKKARPDDEDNQDPLFVPSATDPVDLAVDVES